MSIHSGSPVPGCTCGMCQQMRQSLGVWMHPQMTAAYSQIALQSQAITPSCPPAPQLLPREIVAAPVEGWRIWTVRPKLPPHLCAVGIGEFPWQPVARAQCLNANVSAFRYQPPSLPHPAPHPLCGCGLWAFKDDSRVNTTLSEYAAHSTAMFGYGRVQLWGKIIECEHGWRGEYARPLQVTLLGADDKTAQAIREFYGCEVTVEDEPEWLRAERSAYSQMGMQKGQWRWNAPLQQWVSSTPGVSPIPVPMPVPLKRRRSFVGSLLLLLCLVFAVLNAVFVYLDAFVLHNGHWPLNAAATVATLAAAYLCWDTP